MKADLGFGIELRSQTDSSGVARFDLLSEQELNHLTAWTNDFRIGGFGFNRGPTRDPNEDEHIVELSKCRDHKLRFIGDDGSAVPSVEFEIQVATPQPNVNYVGTNEYSQLKTDSAGEVVYRWFPDWEAHHYYAELVSSGWVTDGDPQISRDLTVYKLKRKKERKQVDGRVVSKSTGAGGFYVSLQSFQGEQDHHSDSTTTFADSAGKFTVEVLPDARYCAYVLDSLWVGEIIDLIPYQPSLDQINPPELSVFPGQEVEVRVTSGPQKKPYPDLTVSFRREHRYDWQEDGETRHGVGGPQWWATTDELGYATTRTLPGKMTVSVYTPKWRTEQEINVGGDKVVRVELHREIDEKRTVTGRLVLTENVQVKPQDVTIQAGAIDGSYTYQETLACGEDGSFSFETLATEIGVFGSSSDGNWAGSVIVKDLETPIELRLRPTLAYEGQLLGNGDRPLVGHRVLAAVRVEGNSDRRAGGPRSFEAQRIESRTDEQGNFTLHGMPSDMKVSILADPIDGSTDSEHLGQIVLEPNESRPRTVSRLAKASASVSDVPLAARYETTLRDCALGGFRLMLISAGGAGPIAEFAHENFVDYERNKEVYGFMQISVNAGGNDFRSEDAAFLKARNWQLPEKGHIIAYAIDADGTELGKLEVDVRDTEAAAKASEFIYQHAPPKVDAEARWAEAFREAKRSNRRVWARVSQRYCGPCFKLARWLDDERELLEKD